MRPYNVGCYGRLTAGNIVAVVFDCDFGFSDGDSSKKEDREDIYADRADAAIEWQRLCEETKCLTVEKNGVMLQTLKTSKRTQKCSCRHTSIGY